MASEFSLTLIMLPFLALMIIAGYYIFVPVEIRMNNKKFNRYRFLIGFWPFLFSAAFVYSLVQSQDPIAGLLGIKVNADYTQYIMMVEGSLVSHFQSFASPALTYLNGFVYLMIFAFLMVFTFIILIYTRNVKTLEEFTIAFIIIYLTAFPFYIFFPVTVTGHTLDNVSPLLYDLSPIIDQGVRVVDPFLDNDFPSGHAALSVMAMLIIVFRTDLRRYKIFAVISTFSILFSTLYLGIHWISDMVAGIILAVISYYIATRHRETLLRIPTRILVAFEARAGIMDHILCKNCSNQITLVPHCESVDCPHCGVTQEYHPLTYE